MLRLRQGWHNRCMPASERSDQRVSLMEGALSRLREPESCGVGQFKAESSQEREGQGFSFAR